MKMLSPKLALPPLPTSPDMEIFMLNMMSTGGFKDSSSVEESLCEAKGGTFDLLQ